MCLGANQRYKTVKSFRFYLSVTVFVALNTNFEKLKVKFILAEQKEKIIYKIFF